MHYTTLKLAQIASEMNRKNDPEDQVGYFTSIIGIFSSLFMGLSTLSDSKSVHNEYTLNIIISVSIIFLPFIFLIFLKFLKLFFEIGDELKYIIIRSSNIILGYSLIYFISGINQNNNITAIDAIYFSIVTWTTLGYGDMSPTESIRLVAASEALVGYIFLGVIVGYAMRGKRIARRYQEVDHDNFESEYPDKNPDKNEK